MPNLTPAEIIELLMLAGALVSSFYSMKTTLAVQKTYLTVGDKRFDNIENNIREINVTLNSSLRDSASRHDERIRSAELRLDRLEAKP